MREILYRACVDFRKMKAPYWVSENIISGSLVNIEGESGDKEEGYYIVPKSGLIKEGFGTAIPVIRETISQYIGLLDKDNTKIFEGDILLGHWNSVYQIEYDECSLQFLAKPLFGGPSRELSYYFNFDIPNIDGKIIDIPNIDGKIIGNVYEMPDMPKHTSASEIEKWFFTEILFKERNKTHRSPFVDSLYIPDNIE